MDQKRKNPVNHSVYRVLGYFGVLSSRDDRTKTLQIKPLKSRGYGILILRGVRLGDICFNEH